MPNFKIPLIDFRNNGSVSKYQFVKNRFGNRNRIRRFWYLRYRFLAPIEFLLTHNISFSRSSCLTNSRPAKPDRVFGLRVWGPVSNKIDPSRVSFRPEFIHPPVRVDASNRVMGILRGRNLERCQALDSPPVHGRSVLCRSFGSRGIPYCSAD